MKKVFLLIYISFTALIFYQIILGKNGIIEGYKVQKETEQVLDYKIKLLKVREQKDKIINDLKSNPDALEKFAHQMGFFQKDYKVIKIIDQQPRELKMTDILLMDNINDQVIVELNQDSLLYEKIKKIRLWISVIYYLFFGFFIFLIIFGVDNHESKDHKYT